MLAIKKWNWPFHSDILLEHHTQWDNYIVIIGPCLKCRMYHDVPTSFCCLWNRCLINALKLQLPGSPHQVTWFPWLPWVAANAKWGAEASFSTGAGQLTFRRLLLLSQEFLAIRPGAQNGMNRNLTRGVQFPRVLQFRGAPQYWSRDITCNCLDLESSMSWSLECLCSIPKRIWGNSLLMHPPTLQASA